MSKAKKKLVIVTSVVLLVVLAFVSIGLMEQGQNRERLAQARSKASRLGIPLDLDEYRTAFQVPNDSENAWPLYVETIRKYRPTFASTDPLERFAGPSTSEVSLRPFWEDMAYWRSGTRAWQPRSEALAVLESMKEVLEDARKIGEKPKFHIDWRFGLGVAEDFQDAAYMLDLGNLLLFDALVAVRTQDFERAEADIASASAISDHLFQMPVWHLLERAIDMASNTMAVARWLVTSETWPEARRANLRSAVLPAMQIPDLARHFRGVVFRGLLTIDSFSSVEKMRAAGLGRRVTNRSAPRPAVREQTETDWLNEAIALLEDWPTDDDLVELRSVMARHEEKLADALRSYNRYIQVRTEAVRPLVPVVTAVQSHIAKVRLIEGMFAGVEIVSREGTPPGELPLTGDSRLDPFDNQPLRFQATDGRFMIYSVGVNGADDGGSFERYGRSAKDWVVRYPDRRTGW